MLGGKGLYRGSSVLISGTAGTGKSSLAADFIAAACRRGENATYFAFEESQSQIIRNMRLDRDRPGAVTSRSGCLHFNAPGRRCTGWKCTWRPCTRSSGDRRPQMVVIDPITNFISAGATARSSRC